jgi:Na+/proline symporter
MLRKIYGIIMLPFWPLCFAFSLLLPDMYSRSMSLKEHAKATNKAWLDAYWR